MLHLQDNPVTGEAMKYVAEFPQLNDLWLNHTKVTAKDLVPLGSLKHLNTLMVTGLGIDDKTIAYVTKLTAIKKLNLGENIVTDLGLPHLAQMPQLKQLELTGCRGVSHTGVSDLLSRTKQKIEVKFATSKGIDLTFSN